MARPKGAIDLEKRMAVLAAAREAFLCDGYGASVEAIASRAGVSKQTVYNQFGSKAKLFRVLADETCAAITQTLSDADISHAPARALTVFGRFLLTMILDPETQALMRVVIEEAQTFPEVATEIFEYGPGNGRRRLAAYLKRLDEAGILSIPDTELAAEQFFGLLLGQQHLKALLTPGHTTSPEEIERRVQSAVRVFLAGYAAGAAPQQREAAE